MLEDIFLPVKDLYSKLVYDHDDFIVFILIE